MAGHEKTRDSVKPLAIDLFCGLGGWAQGFLAEGYEVVGFDIERHRYPRILRSDGPHKRPGKNWSGSDSPGYKAEAFNSTNDLQFTDEIEEYPGQLVLQDVLTLHGSQFRNAAVIVASPPCQAYSYRAMPWRRAKALPPPDNTLFDACFRIQREASEAAGRHIPLVVENVRGAEKWVGPAKWHYGSYYLWGDVPALMVVGGKRKVTTNSRHGWFGPDNFRHPLRSTSAGSSARKAASAQIAKIPFPLAQHIARVYKP